MKELHAIDVCAGAGGWAVAARGLPIRITHAFEIDDLCVETYRANHPETQVVSCDVRTFNFGPLAGQVDLILGGIPCEQISQARACVPLPPEELKAWHELVDRCLELPDVLCARWWCYEDVPCLIKHIPPLTPYFELDSKHFSPQRRKRVYVGNCPKPARGTDKRSMSSCLRAGPYRRSQLLKGRKPKRSNSYDRENFYPWYPDEKSPTVIGAGSRHDNYAAVSADIPGEWRQIEWQELALLQGFPDNYVFIGPPSRVHKQVGQAVQIDTARAILETLCLEAVGTGASAGRDVIGRALRKT